jgi:hypothetical protein
MDGRNRGFDPAGVAKVQRADGYWRAKRIDGQLQLTVKLSSSKPVSTPSLIDNYKVAAEPGDATTKRLSGRRNSRLERKLSRNLPRVGVECDAKSMAGREVDTRAVSS